MPANQNDQRLVFTVTWQVREGEIRKAEEIIARFVPEARQEAGLEMLMVHQSASNPAEFLFYEIFRDRAAFEAHQETPHFRTLIMEQALPLLAKRERIEYRIL